MVPRNGGTHQPAHCVPDCWLTLTHHHPTPWSKTFKTRSSPAAAPYTASTADPRLLGGVYCPVQRPNQHAGQPLFAVDGVHDTSPAIVIRATQDRCR